MTDQGTGRAPGCDGMPIPEGYVLSSTRGPYTTHNGPFYHKVTAGGFGTARACCAATAIAAALPMAAC
ncbi:MAG: hypothetical protein WBN97_06635 [Parvibaculum sp.]